MVRRASRWEALAVDLSKLSTVFEARPCFSWEAPSLWQRPSALWRDSSNVNLWSGAHPWVGQDCVILKSSLSNSVSVLPGVTSSWCERVPWPLIFFFCSDVLYQWVVCIYLVLPARNLGSVLDISSFWSQFIISSCWSYFLNILFLLFLSSSIRVVLV